MTPCIGLYFRIGGAVVMELTGAALAGWGAAVHRARPMAVGVFLFALAIALIWSIPDPDIPSVSPWLRAMRYLPKRLRPWSLGKAMGASRVERVDSPDSD